MSKSAFALVSASLILVSSSGCKSEAREHGTGSGPSAEAKLEPLPEPKMIPSPDRAPLPKPKLAVELPPTPTEALEGPDVPAKYDDGAFSIAGLRADLDAQLERGEAGSTVEVRAFVQEIVVPTCAGSDGCGYPYFWVTDGPEVKGRRLALLVGPYKLPLEDEDLRYWAGEPEVLVEVGKQYRFKGNFMRMSDVGFSSPRGVLQFHAVETEAGEWVYPPGSPAHPKFEAISEERFGELRQRLGN